METNTQNENRIFQYAFTGAVLFIVALAFIVNNAANIINLQLPYTITASILSTSAASLLYKAIKYDGLRIKGL